MRRTCIVITMLLCLLAADLPAQRRGGPVECTECPAPDSWTCQMWPDVCATCEVECVSETLRRQGKQRAPRDRNLRSYVLPATIAVMQLNYELYWNWWGQPMPVDHPFARWTTEELLDDISSHGIRGVKIWMRGDPFDGTGSWCWSPEYWAGEEPFSCQGGEYGLEDMYEVFAHPGIDVYMIRFVSDQWSIQEHNSCGVDLSKCTLSGKTFANEPTFDLAVTFLERYGHLDKTIIFTDWEQDWQARGQNSRGYDDQGNMLFPWADANPWYSSTCWEEYGYQECGEQLVEQRWQYVLDRTERRQMAIEQARALYPRANLRIVHELIVNRYPANFDPTDLGYYLVEAIPTLEYRPDFIGISYWNRAPIEEAIRYITEVTGYPSYRIIIDELGEKDTSQQYDRIWNEGRVARCLGVRVIAVWMWKQTFCAKNKDGSVKNHGLFEQLNCPKPSDFPQQPVQFGEPRPGLEAAQGLQRWEYSEEECAGLLSEWP